MSEKNDIKNAQEEDVSSLIKQIARREGFSACSVGIPALLEEDKQRLLRWLAKGYHGDMSYMARDTEKRAKPAMLLKNARSIIMLAYHYAPPPSCLTKPPFSIARFALGLDYHDVLIKKITGLVHKIQEVTGKFNYHIYVDSSPLLEKAWAAKTGLGWIGKNTLLQIPGKGSWFLLGEIITDLHLIPDKSDNNQYCGNCRRCLEACPTQALVEPYVLDARKCLSYINHIFKGELHESTDLHGRLYGCDLCQEVCPYNNTELFNSASWLAPNTALALMEKAAWEELTEEKFSDIFKGSSIFRKGFQKLKRNIKLIQQKTY